MKLDIIQRRNFIITTRIILAGVVISMVYPVFKHGLSSVIHYINAIVIGLIGGSFVSFCELDLFRNLKRPRSFIPRVIIKVLVYFIGFAILIPLIILVCESFYYRRSFEEHFHSVQFQEFIFEKDFGIILLYALFFIAVVIFTREISLKLGQGILWSYLTGKYHHPQTEDRLFMFIDIRESTRIAEKLSTLDYHAFVDEFIKDATPHILKHRGVIYRYVGDQIGVTWPTELGIRNANCIRLFFVLQNAIFRKREKYLLKYGFIPRFVACLHEGPVVVGELGDVKSQIVYAGETIHTLGLIENQYKHVEQGTLILISGQVVEKMQIPALFELKNLGKLDGISGKMDVYTLGEKQF